MPPAARVTTFRIGSPRRRGEGLRIAATRLPPRGVPRSRWRSESRFDVWLPALAPSLALLRRRFDPDDAASRRRFFAAYERELARPQSRQLVATLAAIAQRTPIALGCFCEDESRCHRSVLVRAVRRAAREGRA